MLDPEYYRNCADEVIELYSKLELRITRDVVRRIMKTGLITDTAKQQVEVALQSGELYDDIIQEVSAISGESEEIIREIFEDAGIETSKEDFVRVGLNPEGVEMSPAMEQVLKAGITKTNGLVKNLTMTTARTTQTAYIEACSLAELEITSGAFDYNTAIRHAVDSAAESGLKVEYPSGHTDLLDVAIRRAVMTGVTQTTSQVSLANCDTIGTDLVEVSAHGGARPEHAEWQGKIFCINGSRGRYKDFYKETGYGTGPGLCGWNCRHSFYPFLEGVSTPTYTKKEIQRLNEQTVEYEGEQIPQYEAEQKQRAMERQIRKDRRELVAYDEALKNCAKDSMEYYDYKSDFDRVSVKLKTHEAKYKDFSKQTGLLTQKERLQTRGFNHSVSQKAVASSQRHYDTWKKDVGATNLPKNLADYYKMKYNDKEMYSLLQKYMNSIENGELSTLCTFDNYLDVYNEINEKLIGTRASNGIIISGVSDHYIARAIGGPKNARSGVKVDDQLEALTSSKSKISDIIIDKDGRPSIRFVSGKCIVSVNPESKVLIQTNPK